MKLKQMLVSTVMVCTSISLKAQSGVLQTITSNAKNSATTKVVESTNKTLNRTLDNILDGSLFKRKESKSNKADTVIAVKEQPVIINSTPGTQLTIANIDYSSIAALADMIKANKNVTDVQKSFSNGDGVINVSHSCNTEDILDDILKNTSGKYDVAELSKGKIRLKAKSHL